MDIWVALVVAVITYLLACMSFARLVTRLFAPSRDVSQFEIPLPGTDESYKAIYMGGNTVTLNLGGRAGGLVSMLDVGKVFVPTLACRLLFPEQPSYMLIAATAGMAGHIWPIFHRFRGGGGFSPALGGLLVVDWPAAIATPVIGLLLGVLLRNLLVASLSWFWLLIPWMWFRTQDPAYLAYAVAINALFALAMTREIRVALKLRRDGKYAAYLKSTRESTPMVRGILKLAARLGMPMEDPAPQEVEAK
ncbi:MAG: glycerol-3-phosphate acyltransferase [Chloroflexota bacterium]